MAPLRPLTVRDDGQGGLVVLIDVDTLGQAELPHGPRGPQGISGADDPVERLSDGGSVG
jgi:hypothetical protein